MGFGTELLSIIIKKVVHAWVTCMLVLGGALVGAVIGALEGHTTKTGLVRGSVIGVMAGATTAVQLFESAADGKPLYKVALLCSLMNGNAFLEWVIPAVLKAYQMQISEEETIYGEISDIYDTHNGVRGLTQDCIEKIPRLTVESINTLERHQEPCCSICLQDFDVWDSTRKLPHCRHSFHSDCLDEWLTHKGSCPICRSFIFYDTNEL